MSTSSKTNVPFVTEPRFAQQASDIAFQMSRQDVAALGKLLQVNDKLAVENFHRYQAFHSPDTASLSALLAYTGIVFKHLNPSDFTKEDFEYAQDHLRLTSFCYGLLRPLDAIKMYRLEGNVRLPELGDSTLFEYWRDHLTDTFIEDIQKEGGVLCNLASDEMRSLFDWKRVEESCRIITPEFKVYKKGKPATVVVYTKMCRGEMTRFLLKNRIESLEQIRAFEWEGFTFDADLSEENRPVFTMR